MSRWVAHLWPCQLAALVVHLATFGSGAAVTTCETLGCGNRSSVCSCDDRCWSRADCCPDFEHLCSIPATVALRDINIVVTTDIHSWIEGRSHQPYLNATFGHAVSLVQRLRNTAREHQRDVFFFDNGDVNDGTGFSATAQDHVAFLAGLLRQAPYDALNLGNHELYQLDAGGAIPGHACAIVGLNATGFISAWGGRYLTSNVVWAGSGEPVGSRFTVLKGEFGTRLLVFGFLYNMDDHCNAVRVLTVEDTLASEWFLQALREHAPESDAVVVLAHMDYRDELVDKIWRAIRNVSGRQKPIQFLTGHSHIRGFRMLDSFASSYEAGCKLDTVGFVSFYKTPPAGSQALDMEYADVNGNTAVLAAAAHLAEADLLTPDGAAIGHAIESVRESLGLNRVLGRAEMRYRVGVALAEPDSLVGLYMNRVLPEALLIGDTGRRCWCVLGTSALVYDMFPGTFTLDDAYTVSPYGNFWFEIGDVPGSVLQELLNQLNTLSRQQGWAVPNYAATSLTDLSATYDTVYNDFDAPVVEAVLKNLTGRTHQRRIFRPGTNTSSVLADWFSARPSEVFI